MVLPITTLHEWFHPEICSNTCFEDRLTWNMKHVFKATYHKTTHKMLIWTRTFAQNTHNTAQKFEQKSTSKFVIRLHTCTFLTGLSSHIDCSVYTDIAHSARPSWNHNLHRHLSHDTLQTPGRFGISAWHVEQRKRWVTTFDSVVFLFQWVCMCLEC